MSEWHVTPDYIVNNWTDELFVLMCEKLNERKTGKKPTPSPSYLKPGTQVVSDEKLFTLLGNKIKVERKQPTPLKGLAPSENQGESW